MSEGPELVVLLALLGASALRFATPLVLAALGELVAERAGVLNIGIEGMMLAGALAAYLAGVQTGSALLACAAALAAGAALAAVFALFVLGRGADPIVCGTALNLLALGGTGSIHRVLDVPVASAAHAPLVAEWLPGVHPFEAIALVLACATGFALARTRLGLVIRASGEGAYAAHAQGIAVQRVRLACTLFGGALAGLAGATLVLWISDAFVEGMTGGRGFIALALVLFGGYQALRIAAGALLFGLASAAQFQLQAAGVEVSYNLLLMLPYLVTLLVLSLFARRSRAPADLARPFDP